MKLRHVERSMRRGLNGLSFMEGRSALLRGVLPSLEHQGLLRALSPALVVDVGANCGQFSLDVRRAVPEARVVAFEPLAPEADTYSAVFSSTPRHVLHRCALGSRSGSASLHVSAARDSSSLLPIGERQSQLFPGTEEVGIEVVNVRKLDDFADEFTATSPALLKIDVQGAELDVLNGAAAVLGLFRWVYLEMSFLELYEGQPLADSMVEELRARGFRIAGVGAPSIVAGRPVQVDALFSSERRPDAQ